MTADWWLQLLVGLALSPMVFWPTDRYIVPAIRRVLVTTRGGS